MFELYNLGIKEKDIIEMINQNNEIKELSETEIKKKIEILKEIGCSESQIKNILISNPYYLDRIDSDIIKLLTKLIELKFNCLNILFDSNPFILNKDPFEIDDYIKKEIQIGKTTEEIVDDLESNPFLFEEM